MFRSIRRRRTDSIIEREVKTFKPVIDAERRWPR